MIDDDATTATAEDAAGAGLSSVQPNQPMVPSGSPAPATAPATPASAGSGGNAGLGGAPPSGPVPPMQPGGFPTSSAAGAAGPGVLRSILGVFLTGISAGLQGGPGPQGPARAAAIGQQSEQANIDRPRAQEAADLDTSMKKAQLAMLQINLQRSLMIYHSQEPALQNAKLMAWIANGEQVEANAAKGQGEVLFTTSPDQDPTQAFQALNTEWMAHIKKGEYDVIPYATGDPAKPILGLYKFKNSQWQGGDYWSTSNPEDPTHPIESRIPDGIKQGGTAAVQKWGLSVDNRMEKSRHDAAVEKGKQADIAATGAIKKSIVTAQIAGANWRAQLHETHADARAMITKANKTNDKEYVSLVKQYQSEIDKADKWAQDNKMSLAFGWKDNPFSSSVDAYQKIVQDYEARHPDVLNVVTGESAAGGKGAGGPKAKPAAPGAKVRVKLADGRQGTVDRKDFDSKTMTELPAAAK